MHVHVLSACTVHVHVSVVQLQCIHVHVHVCMLIVNSCFLLSVELHYSGHATLGFLWVYCLDFKLGGTLFLELSFRRVPLHYI